MKKIVIIGAGAMGSAFTVPCADNSHEVFLVGSFLEDDLINEINKLDNFHPILKCQLPKKIKVIKFSDFNKDIIKDIDLLVVGVSSKGIEWVGEEISKFYNDKIDILLLTKGLTIIDNKFETLAEKLDSILKEKGIANAKISAVAGPCLANGLVNRINSSVVLANENINKNFIKNLTEKLLLWTGERWIITLSKNAEAKSIYEKNIENKSKKVEKFKKSKFAKDIQKAFPDAKLIDLKEEE